MDYNSKAYEWKPVEGNIMTSWAKEVTPQNTLNEYPRPQMVRNKWMNLNGLWDYKIAPKEAMNVTSYDGKILVPYPLESALSGVKKQLLPSDKLWYRRTFTLPEDWNNQKLLLHFGAVDWETTVYINGIKAGQHIGGYCPFTFEISKLLKEGINEIVVSVWDPTDTCNQEKGKQVLKPEGMFYTPISGIWQTVWLEPVPQTYIEAIKLLTDIDKETLKVDSNINGDIQDLQIEISAYADKTLASHAKSNILASNKLKISSPKLWNIDSPFLYHLNIKLWHNDRLIDEIDSYFGMRKISCEKDSRGNMQVLLNNKPIFQSGLLDQGYWPDGLYTPPTYDALRYDIEVAKKLGFNMLRKHIKVEPALWYYYCDKLGMLVWQDMPSGGSFNYIFNLVLPNLEFNFKDNTADAYKKYDRRDTASKENFKIELKEMIDTLYNYPCIITWVPFNEGWGQFDAAKIATWLKAYDPSRLLDHASGWFDQKCGDFKSVHTYIKKLRAPKNCNNRAFVISEFGGYGYKVNGHVWHEDEKHSYSYSGYKSKERLTVAYKSLISNQVIPLIDKGLTAIIYTQLTDIETEINGILTYDREMVKIDSNVLVEFNKKLYKLLC